MDFLNKYFLKDQPKKKPGFQKIFVRTKKKINVTFKKIKDQWA